MSAKVVTTGPMSVTKSPKPELCFVTSWRAITKPTWPELNIPQVLCRNLIGVWLVLCSSRRNRRVQNQNQFCQAGSSRLAADRTKHEAHVLKGSAKTGQFAVWAWNRQTGFTWNYRHKDLPLDRKGWQQNGEKGEFFYYWTDRVASSSAVIK